MNVNEIVQQLRGERSKLDSAIRALEGISAGRSRVKRPATGATRKRRTLSLAARKRIADATRKRWAAAKRSGKKRL